MRDCGRPLRSPSDTRGGEVTFPCPHAAERLFTTLGDLFAPQCAFTKQFFFFLLFLLYCWYLFQTQPFFRERDWDCPSYYARQWIPVAQWLARRLRSSPFTSATGRNLLLLSFLETFGNFGNGISLYTFPCGILLHCCVKDRLFIYLVSCSMSGLVCNRSGLSIIMKPGLCLLNKDR